MKPYIIHGAFGGISGDCQSCGARCQTIDVVLSRESSQSKTIMTFCPDCLNLFVDAVKRIRDAHRKDALRAVGGLKGAAVTGPVVTGCDHWFGGREEHLFRPSVDVRTPRKLTGEERMRVQAAMETAAKSVLAELPEVAANGEEA